MWKWPVPAEVKGTRYEATVPDTLDLADRAEVSLRVLTGALDPELNYELYFYVRYRGWFDCLPESGPGDSRFYLEHPEWRNVGPDGAPVVGLSVAFPEVREHLCRFYAELAGFGADGVSPCYIRGCPIVLYERPMVEGFEAEYRQDPRELAEDDPRWLDYTAKIVTVWMRQVKEAIGSDCRLSPLIHGSRELNRRFGMDIETWVAEGIVSDLFIMCHQYDRWGNHSQAGPEFLDYDWFEKMEGRKNVRLWPMFYPWQNWDADVQGHFDALGGWLDQGADGYGVWDCGALPADKAGNIWDLGKAPRPQFQKPRRLVAKHEMVQWDGYLYNRYTPIEGW